MLAKRDRRFLTSTVAWAISTWLLSGLVGAATQAIAHALPPLKPTPVEIRMRMIQQETSDRFQLMQMQVEQMRANRAFEQKRREAVSLVTGLDNDVSATLVRLSDHYQMPVDHVLGLVSQESSFNINAEGHNRNGTTDHGLMQLNDGGTLQWLGNVVLGTKAPNPYDPVQNLQMGMWYLRHELDRCGGDWECTRSHYNGDSTGAYATRVDEQVGRMSQRLREAWTKVN